MPKKKRRSSALPRTLIVLAVIALLLFLGGEAWLFARSGRGQVALARWGLGDRNRIVGINRFVFGAPLFEPNDSTVA